VSVRATASPPNASRVLVFNNRQRLRRIDLPLLKRLTRHVLEAELDCAQYELGFHLVDAAEMAQVNEQFLQHDGSTDVITFDHRESAAAGLHGEVFICVADALEQASHFGTSWQSELARYVIHALLHLSGYDDMKPALRRVMKREENRLLRRIERAFDLSALERRAAVRPKER
jgi:probable rRNA maturation factor